MAATFRTSAHWRQTIHHLLHDVRQQLLKTQTISHYLALCFGAAVLGSQLIASHATGFLLAAVVISFTALAWSVVISLLSEISVCGKRLIKLLAWSEVLMFASWILFEPARPWWAQAAVALPLVVLFGQIFKRQS
ncbi:MULTISPECIES: hypothetical protein [Corallincola]|uniref:Uncharacterized protein n=3 Tax=Corallincola TaxID=1775176 RepID=A0A368NNE8_9GAMM|nr:MULTISPECIES: hypothetical protein [Corallincola]RCU50831.1 hypothetical protein DU002_05755 [Corallincola holothuriorum]TAA45789.1 hypothetical protein EXY25_10545 [Corallincola spongiicola]TCI03887.1 hypothetical protein EZV61_06745 [Corallincola luteus]